MLFGRFLVQNVGIPESVVALGLELQLLENLATLTNLPLESTYSYFYNVNSLDSWGAEDLADSIGASSNRNPDGSYGFTYELARSLTVLGAATAGVTAIETISADFKDLEALRLRAEKVRRDGFRGMLAIHPAQIDVINAAFTPTEAELAEAQEIVDIFAANPGVGAIGWKGGMLDRPYLSRAQTLLRQAGRL